MAQRLSMLSVNGVVDALHLILYIGSAIANVIIPVVIRHDPTSAH